MSMPAESSITLPAGWSVAGFRETTQANTAGQLVQGVVFSLARSTGGTTSVFVPNNLLSQTAAVEAALNERIQAITAITG